MWTDDRSFSFCCPAEYKLCIVSVSRVVDHDDDDGDGVCVCLCGPFFYTFFSWKRLFHNSFASVFP